MAPEKLSPSSAPRTIAEHSTNTSGLLRTDIAESLTLLGEAMGRELSPAALGLAVEALVDLGVERVAAACARALRECDSYPTPATLRRFAGAFTTEQITSADAEAAWERVVAHCRAVTERERSTRHGYEPERPYCPDCGGQGWVVVSGNMPPAVRRCPCVAKAVAERNRALLPLPDADLKLVKQLGGLARFRRVVDEGQEEFGYLRRDFLAAWDTAEARSKARAAQDRRMLAAGDDGSDRDAIAAPRGTQGVFREVERMADGKALAGGRE